MRVKLEWLNELVDITGISIEQLVNTLSLYAVEVEGVDKVVQGTNLVIGHVLEKVPHPNSDHLSICQVDLGSEVTQIVCGAPNVDKGQYVIVATNGSELPNGIKIKKSKIRGEESNGMICSLSELGMEKKYIPEEYQSGIYYFTDEVKVGEEALQTLNLGDEILELGITPNRGDLMSMLGVAYEVSAVFNRPLKPLAWKVTETEEKNTKAINVKIEDDDCSLYYAKVFKDLKIAPSPRWLRSRLIAFGIRPINNVVDITNYILALFGQPLHAFDYAKLGKNIVVRKALNNEKLVTLDNNERVLLPTDLVITDGNRPVALAGVMGGLETEITPETKDMVLEVAVFNSISIRKTSMRLNLRSEASMRYERGIDANRSIDALNYASYLLQTLASATVLKGYTVDGTANIPDKEIKITKQYIDSYLGTNISSKEIKEIIERLNFKAEVKDDCFTVLVPNRRLDVVIPADLVEEIGRIYGYEHLPLTLPHTSVAGGRSNYQTKRRMLKNTLYGKGLNEVINYSLISDNDTFKANTVEGEDINLIYPLSTERKTLRRNLVPSLLNNIIYANNRKIKDNRIFEIGKVYTKRGDNYHEEEYLAIAISGKFSDTSWQGKEENADFYLLKGIVDSTFKKLGITFEYAPIVDDCGVLHPYQTAQLYYNKEQCGYLGTLHPLYVSSRSELKDVWICEVNIAKLLQVENEQTIYHQISKVPSVERDLAFVVQKDISAQKLIDAIKTADKNTLQEVKIFDVYVGDKLSSDEKSIAVKLIFTSNETLTDEVINKKIDKILKQCAKDVNARLRD